MISPPFLRRFVLSIVLKRPSIILHHVYYLKYHRHCCFDCKFWRILVLAFCRRWLQFSDSNSNRWSLSDRLRLHYMLSLKVQNLMQPDWFKFNQGSRLFYNFKEYPFWVFFFTVGIKIFASWFKISLYVCVCFFVACLYLFIYFFNHIPIILKIPLNFKFISVNLSLRLSKQPFY